MNMIQILPSFTLMYARDEQNVAARDQFSETGK
jgi:hypothetical protein